MDHRYWPMFDLRLTTDDLQLRHLTEAGLGPMAAILARRHRVTLI